MGCLAIFKKPAEKLIFFRLIKNAPASAQAGRCEFSFSNPVYGGARKFFVGNGLNRFPTDAICNKSPLG